MRIRGSVWACVATTAASAALLALGWRAQRAADTPAPDLAWLAAPAPAPAAAPAVRRLSPFGAGPAVFEPNRGQAPAGVRFVRRGPRDVTHVADDGFTTVVADGLRAPLGDAASAAPAVHGVRVRFADAAGAPETSPEEPLAGVTNYFRGGGGAPATSVPHFARVRQREVWPGVDVVYRGRDGRMEYDFLLAAGADAGVIALDVEGADDVSVDAAGDLVLGAGAFEIRHTRPVVWQDAPDGRRPLACAFVLDGAARVRFRVTGADPGLPVVIDPAVEISRRIGGNANDAASCVAATPDGGAVVGGIVLSTDVFGVGPLAGSRSGASDAFVALFAPTQGTGTSMTALDLLGGTGDDGATDLLVAPDGTIHVAGYTTDAASFPRMLGESFTLGGTDAFAVTLSPDATALRMAVPFGGTGVDVATHLAFEPGPENATPTSLFYGVHTTSTDLPLLPGAGAGRKGALIRLDTNGFGLDATIFARNLSSNAPVCVAFDEAADRIFAASFGSASGFVADPGAFQATTTSAIPGFIASFSPDLDTRHAGTFFGGTVEGTITGFDVVPGGGVAATGLFSSGTFPRTGNAAFPAIGSGVRGFFGVLDRDLTTALTMSDVGASNGFTAMSSLFCATTTGGPHAVLLGTSNALAPVGGGDAFHGTLGTGPSDVVVVVLPTAGGPPAFISYDGSTASDAVSPSFVAGRGIEFGIGGAVQGNTLVLAYHTLATGAEFPELEGPAGSLRDAVVRSEDTPLVFDPSAVATPLDVDLLSGSLTLPKREGLLGKVALSGTIGAPDGFDFGLGEGGTLTFDLSGPTSATSMGSVWRLDVDLADGTLKSRGLVEVVKGTGDDGTKFSVTLDTRRDPARFSVAASSVPLPTDLGLFGEPIGGDPFRFEVTLRGDGGDDVALGRPRGNRIVLGPVPNSLFADLQVTPPRVSLGTPNTVAGILENPTDGPLQVTLVFRHNGFQLLSNSVLVPARDDLTLLPGVFMATLTAATPRTGRQKWELLVDGKVRARETTTTTK